MQDDSVIHSEQWRPFTPAATASMHATSMAFIEEMIATLFDGKTVVVSHHGVSHEFVADEWDGDPSTPAFRSDLRDLIERYQPALWVHGHNHNSRDDEIGANSVICNPKGYDSQNLDFDPDLVVEIGGYTPKPPGM